MGSSGSLVLDMAISLVSSKVVSVWLLEYTDPGYILDA